MSEQEEPGVWVKTEPSVDGSTYTVTVEVSDDAAVVLTPDNAMAYASTVLHAAQRAEYDAAVFAQMKKHLSLRMEVVAQVIVDLREDRPPLDHSATAPLRLDPGVNPAGHPFLSLYVNEKQVGQWDVPDARSHALGVLEAVHAADLDAAYYRLLRGTVKLDEPVARSVVEDVGAWRS